MEAGLLFLIFHVAHAFLVVQVLEHLAQDGAQVLRRHVFIGAAAQLRYFHVMPVGKVEGGAVAVRGILRGVDVALAQLPDIGLRAQDRSDYQLIGIEAFGGQRIQEILSDAVQQGLGRRDEVRDGVREGVHHVGVRVFQPHQAALELFGRGAVLHGRDADGLRHAQLYLVHIVEFPRELDVVDAPGMVFYGAQGQPAALLHAAFGRFVRPERQGQEQEDAGYLEGSLVHNAKIVINWRIGKYLLILHSLI